jgi:hypothetical protein
VVWVRQHGLAHPLGSPRVPTSARRGEDASQRHRTVRGRHARWTSAKSGYNPEWSNPAIDGLRQTPKHFSASQAMYLIYLVMCLVGSTHQQGGVEATRMGQVLASSITSFSQCAAIEHWDFRGMFRPAELPRSTHAPTFAHEVTRLDDEYLTLRPLSAGLRTAMTRCRTIH